MNGLNNEFLRAAHLAHLVEELKYDSVLRYATEEGPKVVLKVRGVIDNYSAHSPSTDREVAVQLLARTTGLVTVPSGVSRKEGWLMDDIPSVYVHWSTGLDDPVREQLLRLAIFDYLIDNGDRHGGNWLLTPQNLVVGLDHELSFGRGNGYTSGWSDPMVRLRRGQGIAAGDEKLTTALLPLLSPELGEELVAIGIPEKGVKAMVRRAEDVLEHGFTV